MTTTDVHQRRLTVRRGVVVSLTIVAILSLAVTWVWTHLDLPVEYRTASVWVPAGAMRGDAGSIPVLSISLSDYKARAPEFTTHVVSATYEEIVYTGFQESLSLPFQAFAELPSVQEPQGFWYKLSEPFDSMNVASGTVTYRWSARDMAVPIIIILVGTGILILSVVFSKTFFSHSYEGNWLSRPFVFNKR